MKKGGIYETERLGKIKIIELGTVGVRLHQYVGYNGKPETFTMTIRVLKELVGELND